MNKIIQMLPKGASKITSIKSLKPVRLKDMTEVSHIFETGFKLDNFFYDTETDVLYTDIQFKDFKQSMCFMNNVAILADQMEHHPEWFNVYNKVQVVLSTHDCNGLSLKDFFMARAINKLIPLVVEGEKDYAQIIVEDWETFLD